MSAPFPVSSSLHQQQQQQLSSPPLIHTPSSSVSLLSTPTPIPTSLPAAQNHLRHHHPRCVVLDTSAPAPAAAEPGNENRASHNRYDVHKARRDLSTAVAGLESRIVVPGSNNTGIAAVAPHVVVVPASSLPGSAVVAPPPVAPGSWSQQQQGAALFHGADLSTAPTTTGLVCAPAPVSRIAGDCVVGSVMGGGSSKHGGYKHKDKKRHSKSSNNACGGTGGGGSGGSGHKIMVQQAASGGIGGGSLHNENHHNALSDSPRPPIPETLQAKPGVDFNKFKVIKLKAAIDKKPTTIDEKSSAVLKYRTPHFRALATVEVPPLEENQSVQVGWIQTCTEMRFVNTYSDHGVTSWEFPEIISGKFQMIGDADGKQYPWYGSKNELTCVTGPTKENTPVTVHMNDNFFPQVTWYIPDGAYDKTPRLTHIHRAQRFYTYLVAQDLSGGQRYHILRVVEWAMELHIDVNPHNPLGKRAKLLGPFDQTQPRTIPSNLVPLQPYALKPPNANNAQTLVWRPYKGEPKIIVPPIETTMDMEKYITATRNLDMSRADQTGVRR